MSLKVANKFSAVGITPHLKMADRRIRLQLPCFVHHYSWLIGGTKDGELALPIDAAF